MLSETLANFYLQLEVVVITYTFTAVVFNLVNYFINVAKVEKMRVSSTEHTEKSLYRWQKYVQSGGSRFAMIILAGLWNWVTFKSIETGVTEKILLYTKSQMILIQQNLKWGLVVFLLVTVTFLSLQVIVSSLKKLKI